MKFYKLIFISYTSLIIFLPISITYAANKKLEYVDKIYEDQIKTVILFQGDDIKATPLSPAALPITQRVPLVLKFDELYTDDADYYNAKIIHCNLDWRQSNLSEMQYLYDHGQIQYGPEIMDVSDTKKKQK